MGTLRREVAAIAGRTVLSCAIFASMAAGFAYLLVRSVAS